MNAVFFSASSVDAAPASGPGAGFYREADLRTDRRLQGRSRAGSTGRDDTASEQFERLSFWRDTCTIEEIFTEPACTRASP